MTSPIAQVKDAISSGTTTRAGIAHVTGLKIGTALHRGAKRRNAQLLPHQRMRFLYCCSPLRHSLRQPRTKARSSLA